MRIELTELVWVEEQRLSFDELAVASRLPPQLLHELIGCGAIAPLEAQASPARFGARALTAARAARRLRDDFELDAGALALALGLLDRVSDLEAELRQLRARLPTCFR
jgi:chaperone modulatory protein CbpM